MKKDAKNSKNEKQNLPEYLLIIVNCSNNNTYK